MIVFGLLNVSEKSPSPRRAWIEISMTTRQALKIGGRPPLGGRGLKSKESLDPITAAGRPPLGGRGLKYFPAERGSQERRRPPLGGRGLKLKGRTGSRGQRKSPSPRRAWIEIRGGCLAALYALVALPSEGVD